MIVGLEFLGGVVWSLAERTGHGRWGFDAGLDLFLLGVLLAGQNLVARRHDNENA